jgi:DNA-directed RNA polymerase subunit E'/Rpb7
MQNLIVQEIICLEPMYLDSNIKAHILKKLKTKFINICTKKYGYIIDVTKIINFADNSVSSASNGINFNVTFEISTLKPEINNILIGEVCMIISKGIFVNIANKLKVLIPIDKMNGYVYSQSTNSYKKNQNQDISINCNVTVKLLGIKYTKNSFLCFSELM